MKLLLTIILFLAYSFNVLSQEEIRVYNFKGKIEYSTDNKSWNNQNLVGLRLEKNMSFRVDQVSEISFINKTGKVFKITSKGTFNANYIQQGLKSVANPSFVASYAEFVWEKLRTHHAKAEEYSKGNLKESGMVSRGCTLPLMIYPPDNSAIIDTTIVFAWQKKSDSAWFNFTINSQGSTFKKEVYLKDSFFRYFIPISDFKADNRLSWYVLPVKGKNYCYEYRLYVLPADTIARIRQLVKSSLQEEGTDMAWKHFRAATLYEDYNVFINSREEYLKAMELSDMPLIRESYELFLKEYGF